jgi:hypothetical protein
MVLPVRIELTTSPLPRGCSTTELRQRRPLAKMRTKAAVADAAILATRPEAAQAHTLSISDLFRARSGGRNLPCVNDRPKAAKKARQQRRLGAALRENLRRRKAQARGRSTAGVADGSGKPHDSAGIGGNKRES